MGGSSGGDKKIHYAAYVENAHTDMLNKKGADTVVESVVGCFNLAYGNSPYTSGIDWAVNDSFFSTGYAIQDFPSLWDMFGKFMAGVDVHNLFLQTYNGLVSSAEVNAAVSAQAAYLDDDMAMSSYPRFEAGMRNINAVQSSAFMIGRTLLEDTRVKAINKFASELRLRTFDASIEMWKNHLSWNGSVVGTYSKMYQLYYSAAMDVNAQDLDVKYKHVTFDLNLFEYLRALIAIVSGGAPTSGPPGLSQTQKSISGALGGAALGYQMSGSPYGALVGGVLGLAASFIE